MGPHTHNSFSIQWSLQLKENSYRVSGSPQQNTDAQAVEQRINASNEIE